MIQTDLLNLKGDKNHLSVTVHHHPQLLLLCYTPKDPDEITLKILTFTFEIKESESEY